MKRALAIALFLIAARSLAAEAPAISTDSAQVFFNVNGAVPFKWTIVDPAFVSPPVDLIQSEPPLQIEAGETAKFFNTAPYSFAPIMLGNRLGIVFRSPRHPSGLTLTKTYVLPQSGFAGELQLEWTAGDTSVTLPNPGLTLGPGLNLSPTLAGRSLSGSLYTFVEPIYRAGGDIGVLKPGDKQHSTVHGGLNWVGLNSRYFAFILVPAAPGSEFMSASAGAEETDRLLPRVVATAAPVTLAPGQTVTRAYALYAGPKDRAALKAAPGGLDGILFHGLWGWMRALCFGLMWVLTKLYAVLHNWGLALIGLAVVVRLALFPIAQSGLKAQAQLNADQALIKPLLEKIKQECKGDALREHEETMKIYKAHGMSPYAPLKGCLWVLLQLPVLIALFQLIGHAYPLRQAHFLWIADLAQPDRLFDLGFSIPLMGHSFNLLPCLMAVTQALTIRFSSSGGSGGQRGTMLAMTLFFFVLFYSFPSGLMLYWMASNLLQVVQQAMIKPAARTPSGGQAEPTAEGAAPAKP